MDLRFDDFLRRLHSIHPEIRCELRGGNGVFLSAREKGPYALGALQDIKKWSDDYLRGFLVDWFPELFERTYNVVNSNMSTSDAREKGTRLALSFKGVFQIKKPVSSGALMSLAFDLADLFGMPSTDHVRSFTQGFMSPFDAETNMQLLAEDIHREDP